MKTIALVPIKLHSERCKDKNIRKFRNGKALISYILNTLLEVDGLDDIYVYCSSREIIEYLPYKVKFLERDQYYDRPSTPFNEVLSSFAQKVDAKTYVLVHATSPFLTKKSIECGIRAVNGEGYDSAFSVIESRDFLWKDNAPLNYSRSNIPRTQDLDELWIETCGLYVYTKELILERNVRIGDNPYLVRVGKIEGWDINTEEDFFIADAISNYLT